MVLSKVALIGSVVIVLSLVSAFLAIYSPSEDDHTELIMAFMNKLVGKRKRIALLMDEKKRLQEKLTRTLQDTKNDLGNLPLPTDESPAALLIALQQANTTLPAPHECEQLKKLLTPSYTCQRKKMGTANIYTVCINAPFTHPATACHSYSFGVGTDWSYDEAISAYCYTHSFDPTLYNKEEQIPRVGGRQITFHKVGITADGRDFKHRNKQLVVTDTLEMIMTELNHTKVDILKLSIDEGEWEVLEAVANSPSIQRVTQLLVEFHFHHILTQRAIKVLTAIESAGFVLFHSTFPYKSPPKPSKAAPCGPGEVEAGFVLKRLM
eukprot:TRINITY_DN49432_c0_g1_i1.p2 TRINITY_DN49432_c0_g1~~TRINITY_DN49432_c0_g1_i1.p2  ORF type:complete len:323 (+),score=33.24 TRINITY_DN49432_c0_g1_i1:70-1038(+)